MRRLLLLLPLSAPFGPTALAAGTLRCARYMISAHGSRGSSATVRRILSDCAPR